MEEGYKLCPYCKNEIKEDAIKCQYCNEFLNGRKQEVVYIEKPSTLEKFKRGLVWFSLIFLGIPCLVMFFYMIYLLFFYQVNP